MSNTPGKFAQAEHGQAPADAPKTFTGGDQGFIDLKLARIEDYNHNTKRFRFELLGEDNISGLNVACKSRFMIWSEGYTNTLKLLSLPSLNPQTPTSQ